MTEATFIKEIVVIDPDSGNEVHMAVYKHENGGMFAMDSSFIEEVPDEYEPEFELEFMSGVTSRCAIVDPFSDLEDPNHVMLIEKE